MYYLRKKKIFHETNIDLYQCNANVSTVIVKNKNNPVFITENALDFDYDRYMKETASGFTTPDIPRA